MGVPGASRDTVAALADCERRGPGRARSLAAIVLATFAVTLVLPSTAAAYGLYVSTPDGISIFDTTDNSLVGVLDTKELRKYGFLVAAPDGRAIYLGTNKQIVKVATQSGEITARFALGDELAWLSGIAVAPDGDTLYAARGGASSDVPGAVSVIDTATMTAVGSPIPTNSLDYQPTANPVRPAVYLLTASTGGSGIGLDVLDTTANTITGPFALPGNNYLLAINPAGTRLYASDGVTTTVIDSTTFDSLASVATPESSDFVVSPDGAYLYSSNIAQDSISTMDTATNALLPDLSVPVREPGNLALTPDGASLYVAGRSLAEIDPVGRTVTDPDLRGDPNFRPGQLAVSLLAPSPPPPTQGKTVNVEAKSGTVSVKCDGDRGYEDLGNAKQIPLGCLIDTTKGHVLMTSSAGGNETQTAELWAGIFKPGQKRGGDNPFTELALAKNVGCKARSAALARGGRRGNKLWGKGKGNFKSKGHKGSATVRGTTWLTHDRCNRTTYFKVKNGVVDVQDKTTGRTVTLRSGESYTAGKKRR